MLHGKWSLNRRCRCRQRFDKNTWVHQGSSYPYENMSPCRIVVSNDISSLLMTSSPNLPVNPCLDWNTTWLAIMQLSLRLRCFAWPVFFFRTDERPVDTLFTLSGDERGVCIHKVQLQVHQTRGTRLFVKSLTTWIPTTPKWILERDVFLVLKGQVFLRITRKAQLLHYPNNVLREITIRRNLLPFVADVLW